MNFFDSIILLFISSPFFEFFYSSHFAILVILIYRCVAPIQVRIQWIPFFPSSFSWNSSWHSPRCQRKDRKKSLSFAFWMRMRLKSLNEQAYCGLLPFWLFTFTIFVFSFFLVFFLPRAHTRELSIKWSNEFFVLLAKHLTSQRKETK